MTKSVWCLILMSLLLTSQAYADIPHVIRFQGDARDSNGVPLEGPYTMTFRIYDAQTAGTTLWEETQPNVAIAGGQFSVLLGQATPLNIEWNSARWLSIQVSTDPELSPRQQITSVPMALRAQVAESLASPTDISARVFNATAISVPHGTYTPLTFNAERWDTDAIHDTAANTSRLTAKTAGKYLIYGHVRFSANSIGHRQVGIRLNESPVIALTMGDATTGELSVISVVTHYDLAANDYVELVVYQNSGSSISVQSANNHSPEFGMVKIP
ncbi:MAG: hypothetical protein HY737_02930 [Candidatus Omnitrophica bacterium]|nr:hypothetical protein [Candidatus Omnitrophota bacterium]